MSAVAAIRLSPVGIARPAAQRSANNFAHRSPVEASQATHYGAPLFVEPLFEAVPAPTSRQEQDAKAQLTEDDRVDGEFALFARQPVDNPRIGLRFGGLRKNVRIDQVAHEPRRHSVSVDSDSTAVNQSAEGHERSQSTTPGFGGGAGR